MNGVSTTRELPRRLGRVILQHSSNLSTFTETKYHFTSNWITLVQEFATNATRAGRNRVPAVMRKTKNGPLQRLKHTVPDWMYFMASVMSADLSV